MHATKSGELNKPETESDHFCNSFVRSTEDEKDGASRRWQEVMLAEEHCAGNEQFKILYGYRATSAIGDKQSVYKQVHGSLPVTVLYYRSVSNHIRRQPLQQL